MPDHTRSQSWFPVEHSPAPTILLLSWPVLDLPVFPKAARETVWLEREERARQHYERHLEARKKKLEDQRLKEERRRAAVEEKRRQRLEEDKVWGGCPWSTYRAEGQTAAGVGEHRLLVSVAAVTLSSVSRGNPVLTTA